MTRIANPHIDFTKGSVPVATDFDDIYFSPENGLAETELVFLQGNNLPHAWQDKDHFTIAETGFGTGLNFLATVAMFRKNRGNCGHLHYISLERFPLSRTMLETALAPWRKFDLEIDRLLAVYPIRIPGFHTIYFAPDISLTLMFDDAAKSLASCDHSVDAWFLDGFAPSKNPTMWHDDLYHQMARLSHNGTTLASFTAAGAVRRGLQDAGFTIERHSGFAHKRHRITGIMEKSTRPHHAVIKPKRVALIGAGLGGATMADALQRHGIACTIFERHPHSGLNASSNQLGLVNPKLDVGHEHINDLGQAMYSLALHRLSDKGDAIDFRQTGALHLAQDDAAVQRQHKIISQLDWINDHVRIVTSDEAHHLCGIPTEAKQILHYPDACMVNTKKLVDILLQDIDVRWGYNIDDIHALYHEYDAVIITSAEAAHTLCPDLSSFLQPMRGQVTTVEAPMSLSCPVICGSYVAPLLQTPKANAQWVTGATFQRNRTDHETLVIDDEYNLNQLSKLIPLDCAYSVTGHWAHIRYTTPDRRPLFGQIADKIYIATALGSHGLQYGFLLAAMMSAQFIGQNMPLTQKALPYLDVQRFLKKLS
jgi:tRNA 5-methylaminomethyl-2-thiouridine biosynthesis bifunctional protein